MSAQKKARLAPKHADKATEILKMLKTDKSVTWTVADIYRLCGEMEKQSKEARI